MPRQNIMLSESSVFAHEINNFKVANILISQYNILISGGTVLLGR